MIAPSTADDWYFTTFSVDMVHGFSIVNAPVLFSSKRPLMAHISGPTECRRGEQLGLRLFLHNTDVNQMIVTVTLLGSPEYKFVHVEQNGIVSSYGARLSSGDHQILIFMKPESQEQLEFPITPNVENGPLNVVFKISAQTGSKQLSHKINVYGEGALIDRHTSAFLDLKNRALVLQYLDIVVEETPIVPYQIWRRYIYGSPTASISVSGDLIGATFTEIPLTSKIILGRHSKGAESVLFELHSNIWTLHYLRLTNQLNWKLTEKVLEECNSLYAEIMRYFHQDGWFSAWDPSISFYPSVWLSAWALRVLKHASFVEWEFNFWVDLTIFTKTMIWILNFQQESGFFIEISENILKSDTAGNISMNYQNDEKHIVLTSHVIISLQETLNLADGELRLRVASAISNGRSYLEKLLPVTRDSFHIAIMTYALTISNSVEKGFAFYLLKGIMKTNADGQSYWSREDISPNPVKFENQRIFIKPRLYDEGISIAVEATSWALLVHLIRDGITPLTENIVQWLISVRMSNNRFISLVDTAIAYEALTEFAFRSRLLGITDIKITIEVMSRQATKYQMRIRNSSLVSPHILQIPSVWGHVNIIAKGSGLALVQMNVNYGIDFEPLKDVPPIEIFELHVTEFYSNFRNKSSVTIQSCFRYSGTESVSNSAVLEVQIPTGYYLVEYDAMKIVKSRIQHPTLRDAHTLEGKTLWFFEYIQSHVTCFNHTVTRWYPVGNMTQYREALIYEINAREHFAMVLIHSAPLYLLNICEVCGSYQCPYCPYYNYSNYCSSSSIFYIMLYYLIKYTNF